MNDGLAEVFRYNRWANLRLIDACRSLTDERLDARVPAERSSDQLVEIGVGLDQDSEVFLPHVGRTFVYPKRFFLAHAAEHGVEHRTEIKLALAQLGVATPDLDGWAYSGAAGYGREVTARP